MRVSTFLEPGGIIIRPPWGSFEEAIEGLVSNLASNGRIKDSLKNSAVRAVCERERMASTAIVEIGVSIPHARVDGIRGVVAAIAASPTALYYAMTRVPIPIVALVLSSPDLVGEHLNFLSAISMLLQSESVRKGLQRATDATAALVFLRAHEGS
jgi:mannitol/fructose-specific phosphotransferase system IIA component (Ntr-type)